MIGGSAADPTERVRVLVVDDNPGFRESLISLLEFEDLEVVGQASNGPEALDKAATTDPDVVLMDVRMPSMDGVETTRRIKDLLPSVGVLALSGFEDYRAVREMLMAGASGYVLKDADEEEIVDAVRRAAVGCGVVSDAITPTVIDELIHALTRERRRARQLEVSHATLLERDARQHQLVSTLGRELRSPVKEIVGMARNLAGGPGIQQERGALLHRLVARAGELARLVQRLEAAVETGLSEWADVSILAKEAAAGRERVSVRAPDSPAMACLNRIAANRILEELLDNALSFSDGEVMIEVSLTPSTPVVRVIDSGPGVDVGLLDLITDHLDGDGTNNAIDGRGPGLGLAIASMSARAMDGDLVLESTGPAGSTFLWTVTSASL